MPARTHKLKIAIESIYWQVDDIYVYLNNFESVPEFLNREKITVFRSQDHEDLRDLGKFYGLTRARAGYYFSVDDDIIYPPDYVAKMTAALNSLDGQAVLGVHGVILPRRPRSFFDRKVFTFDKSLSATIPVSFLGTGTCVFDIERVPLTASGFTLKGMADIDLGLQLKRKNVPTLAIQRQDGWLVEVSDYVDDPSLYQETRQDSSRHNTLIRGAGPWGESDIVERSQSVWATGIMSDAVRFALEVIKRARTGEQKLLNLPPGVVLDRPLVAASKWIQLLCDLPTKEHIYKHALKHRKTWGVQRAALNALWRLNKREALAEIGRLVGENQEDPRYLLYHAVLSARMHMFGEARYYFRIAAQKCCDTVPEGSPALADVLFEFFCFSVSHGAYDDAASLMASLQSTHGEHPLYQRGRFLIHYQRGEVKLASRYLELFFQNRGRRFRRGYISELTQLLRSQNYPVCKTDLPVITQDCLEAAATSPTDLSELIKIALTLGRCDEADTCWAYMCLHHKDYIEGNPELAWYYHSNASFDKGLSTFTPDRGLSGKGWRIEQPLGAFENLARVGKGFPRNINPPKVSVIMSAYNASSTIGYAIESILNQTHNNIEVIVVDDKSADLTCDVVAEFARRDERVHLMVNKENVGPYCCRNIALAVASGEFIAIQDADDVALPDRLAYQLAAFEEETAAVLGTHVRLDPWGRVQLENDGSIVGHGPMTLMFRQEVMRELGGFLEVRTRGDKEFESRIEHYYGAHALKRLPALLVCSLHEESSNSHRHSSSEEQKRAIMLFKEAYDRWHRSDDLAHAPAKSPSDIVLPN